MKQDVHKLKNMKVENFDSHICDIDEEDYLRIKSKIELLERLSEVEHSIYAIFDMHKGNYLLKSAEQKKLFGSTDANKKGDYDNEVLYQNIHPEDLPFVIETDGMVYDFWSKLPIEAKKDYKLVYDFRVKNTEGIYIRYMHQVIVFELDKQGRTWLSLIISNILSEQKTNYKPQRRMINIKTGKLHLFTKDAENKSVFLTKREKEILGLIGYGYDSKTISEKLFISINTVNNHRQNILRKTNAENITQSFLYARRLGII